MYANAATLFTTMIASGRAISTSQIAMLGVAIIALTLLMRSTLRRTRRARTSATPSARARYRQLAHKQETTRDVDHVMLELDRLARDIQGRIDTRFAKLEAVIRDADERIARLARLIRGADADPDAGADAAPGRRSTLDIMLPHEDGHDSTEVETSKASDPRQAIFELADRGVAPAAISEQVGKAVGEIELILALRRTHVSVDQRA